MSSPSSSPQSSPAVDPRLWRIWAKWPRSPKERRYHPLLCHMVDVASVARLMWSRALTPMQRERIAGGLNLDDCDAEAWVAFWAGLHDIGKASPAFQTQLSEGPDGPLIARWLAEAGLTTRGAKWAPHGGISLLLMEDILPREFGHCEDLAVRVAAVVGAHHGLFFTRTQQADLNQPELAGDESWEPVQDGMSRVLASALRLPSRAPQGQISPADAMALAGLISTADWIGSNTHDYEPAAAITASPVPRDLAVYLQHAARQAEKALARVAWDLLDLRDRPRDFARLFRETPDPRGLQLEVIAIAERLTGPGLVIIESPMGEGKTEAAMYLADAWSVRLGQRGIYFALPTQATSNQMFGRVERFLEGRFADEDERYVNLHLAHGMAALSPEYEALQERARLVDLVGGLAESSQYDQSPQVGPEGREDAARGGVIAGEWFAAPKRTLLAPYGVGTVDQALLAALQVKHGFVRLFGLSGKTIIVDEAHAYDTYMSTLLERLLEWLGALGAPVALLSATLPSGRRRRLLGCYAKGAGWSVPHIGDQLYPRVTYVSEAASGCIHVSATTKARDLGLRWVDGTLPTGGEGRFALADELAEALRDGGCAAVVCNTVRRAQAMHRALAAAFACQPEHERPDLYLLHAQLLQGERQRREKAVLDAFGPGKDERQPNPLRPRRAVVVATQVIEQSLDLDFDLMVSDLAPADLLLQRAGRIHRHGKNDPCRSERVKEPTLWIRRPDERADGVLGFDWADEQIYDEHILLRTWLALSPPARPARATLDIPGDVEELVEAVYKDGAAPPDGTNEATVARWRKSEKELREKLDEAEKHAKQCRILPPDDPELFIRFSRQLDEDNSEAHRTIQAQTREGDLRLPVVLLDAAAATRFKRAAEPSLDDARALLGRSVNLSRPGLVKALLDQESVPSGWAKTAWLRNHRVILLDAEGRARFEGKRQMYTITLDPTLGVVVESRAKGG